MSEAHKTPCDDIYCEQFLCVQKRDSEGHVELKDWDKHTAELRASNAALKAENEALKKERDTWKQEHENLVHVRQVDLAAVAGRLEAVTKDRDEWVKRAGEGL